MEVAQQEVRNKQNKDWREIFWQFAWRAHKQHQHQHNSLDAFVDWRVVHVYATGGGEAFITLGEVSSAFLICGVDKDWQTSICTLVQHAGFHILAPSHIEDDNQRELLGGRAKEGDFGLCKLLTQSPNKLDQLSVKDKVNALEYFSSRRNNTAQILKILKSLPLFLHAQPNQETNYSSLQNEDVKYVAIRQDEVDGGGVANHVGNLTRLAIPGVFCLAWPSVKAAPLYEELGVRLIASSIFVAEFLCEFLPEAAQQEDYQTRLQPLLLELESWVTPPPFPQRQKPLCSNLMTKNIVDAASRQAFVRTIQGKFVKPTDILNPRRQVTKLFAKELATWRPHTVLAPHLNLFLQLGMQQKLSAECILECAKALDLEAASGQLSETTHMRSYYLVEDLCRALSERFQGVSSCASLRQQPDDGRLIEAARLRVVLVRRCTAEKTMSYAMELANTFSSAGRPRMQGTVRLASFDNELALTADHLVWSQCNVLARDLWPKPKTSFLGVSICRQIHRLLESNTACEKVHGSLGCLCSSLHASSDLLSKHLLAVATSLPAQEFQSWSFLHVDLKGLFEVLQQSQDDIPMANCTALKKTRCVPISAESDASGTLQQEAQVLRLVLPTKVFLKQPPLEVQRYLHMCPSILNAYKSELCTFLSSIGVQKQPELDDWIGCFQAVWRDASANEGGMLLPYQRKAAVCLLEKCTQELRGGGLDQRNDKSLDMYLFEEGGGRLLQARQLVWADLPSCKDRCAEHMQTINLRFANVDSEIGELLCEHTELRRLSKCVAEVLGDVTTKVEPGENDRKLEILLRSDEFARACVAFTRDSNIDVEAVQKTLLGMEISWSPAPLECALFWTDTHTILSGSSTQYSAFNSPSDGCVWVQTGLLGGEEMQDEQELIRQLGNIVLPAVLRRACAELGPGGNNAGYVHLLTTCWENGPSAIAKACESLDIVFHASATTDLWALGSLVPLEFHENVQQSARYNEGETVAVRDEEETGIIRYRCAEVLKTTTDATAQQSQLSRIYTVDTGGMGIQRLPHFKLYQINSKKQQEQVEIVETNSEEKMGEDSEESNVAGPQCRLGASELKELISQLRQMQNYEEPDYKQMCRRLYLLWHPDKTNHPNAAAFFRIIHRHSKCFTGDKDFDWLSSVASDGNSSAAAEEAASSDMSQPYEAGTDEHTWFDEFRKEEAREQNAVHEAQSRSAAVPCAPNIGGSSFNSTERRTLKLKEADLCWRQSAHALNTATVLLKANIFADSVWHSQQAVEFAIKSLMMRTCGITAMEQKGPKSHDLMVLLGRLVKDGEEWPVCRNKLRSMSDAYLHARYTYGETLPADKYKQCDAEESVEVVHKLMCWVSGCDALSVPPHEKEMHITVEKAEDDSVLFEPAALPPPPPPLPPAIESEPTARAIAQPPMPPEWIAVELDQEEGMDSLGTGSSKRRRLGEASDIS
jgi:HEPN domain-containing protein